MVGRTCPSQNGVEWLTTYLNNHITTITPATPHLAGIAARSTICQALLQYTLQHYTCKQFYRSRFWVYVQFKVKFSISFGIIPRKIKDPYSFLIVSVYPSSLSTMATPFLVNLYVVFLSRPHTKCFNGWKYEAFFMPFWVRR